MTPPARVAAAIECLDAILAGQPAEAVLTNWARRSRFAGSGDRAAIRDLVFDALRRRRSLAWIGGADSGRGLMLGALIEGGDDPSKTFSGERFAPSSLSPGETAERSLEMAPEAVRHDVPDWVVPHLRSSLGDDWTAVADSLRHRAPVFLRANVARTTREEAQAALAEDEIGTRPHDLSPWALEVTSNPRRVAASQAFREGLVELQDAASQAVCAAISVQRGSTVLDYCAGGGGKALALAAMGAAVSAWDAAPSRMRDLPGRADRAGVRIEVLAEPPRGSFDVVLCDAPCSGSGAWRRTPDAKWRLTPDRLADLAKLQAHILNAAHRLVRPGGTLVYATCSLLDVENNDQIESFLSRVPAWNILARRRLTPLDGADGFYWAQLRAPLPGTDVP